MQNVSWLRRMQELAGSNCSKQCLLLRHCLRPTVWAVFFLYDWFSNDASLCQLDAFLIWGFARCLHSSGLWLREQRPVNWDAPCKTPIPWAATIVGLISKMELKDFARRTRVFWWARIACLQFSHISTWFISFYNVLHVLFIKASSHRCMCMGRTSASCSRHMSGNISTWTRPVPGVAR